MEDIEAWGSEPYELDDVDATCKGLVRKGYVPMVDIKYLNKAVPESARVAPDGVVIFFGFPGQKKAKVSELSKFGRPAKFRSPSWWIKYFLQTNLEENDAVAKKFE